MEFHSGPNPKPDVQVSKHPDFQTFLDLLCTGFLLVAGQTKNLHVAQGVSLGKAGKGVYGLDMIGLRCLPGHGDAAFAAPESVTMESKHLEVQALQTPPCVATTARSLWGCIRTILQAVCKVLRKSAYL